MVGLLSWDLEDVCIFFICSITFTDWSPMVAMFLVYFDGASVLLWGCLLFVVSAICTGIYDGCRKRCFSFLTHCTCFRIPRPYTESLRKWRRLWPKKLLFLPSKLHYLGKSSGSTSSWLQPNPLGLALGVSRAYHDVHVGVWWKQSIEAPKERKQE